LDVDGVRDVERTCAHADGNECGRPSGAKRRWPTAPPKTAWPEDGLEWESLLDHSVSSLSKTCAATSGTGLTSSRPGLAQKPPHNLCLLRACLENWPTFRDLRRHAGRTPGALWRNCKECRHSVGTARGSRVTLGLRSPIWWRAINQGDTRS